MIGYSILFVVYTALILGAAIFMTIRGSRPAAVEA